mgnify:CR=1 FL=1
MMIDEYGDNDVGHWWSNYISDYLNNVRVIWNVYIDDMGEYVNVVSFCIYDDIRADDNDDRGVDRAESMGIEPLL